MNFLVILLTIALINVTCLLILTYFLRLFSIHIKHRGSHFSDAGIFLTLTAALGPIGLIGALIGWLMYVIPNIQIFIKVCNWFVNTANAKEHNCDKDNQTFSALMNTNEKLKKNQEILEKQLAEYHLVFGELDNKKV